MLVEINWKIADSARSANRETLISHALSFPSRACACIDQVLLPTCNMAEQFKYSRAVVCGVSASLPGAALRLDEPAEPINLEKARKQHEDYVKVRNLL